MWHCCARRPTPAHVGGVTSGPVQATLGDRRAELHAAQRQEHLKLIAARFAAAAAVLTLAACPKAKAPGALCAASESNRCSCEGGAQGVQTCDSSGAFFGACQCSPACAGDVSCAAMPDLTGMDIATAGATLAALGLSLPDPVDTTAFAVVQGMNDPTVQVLSQSPAPGQPVPMGSSIPMLKVTYPPDQESLGLPNGNFLVDDLTQDTELSAQAYYDALDPQPFPVRSTLADWKIANGFGQPADDEAAAIYVSHADLGFGRHMHMRRKGQRVAFYVDNFPTIDDAVHNTNLFATVAMEWSPAPGTSGPYFTQFYTYNKKGQRITDPKLDEHGAKLQPAVCLTCHGGALTDTTYKNGANLGAKFIPFDLDSLSFSDKPGFRREDQEDQLKKLNLAVLLTANDDPDYTLPDRSPVAQLIEGWYAPALSKTTQDNSWTPPGWLEDSDAPALYHGVVAKSCRGCHDQREPYRTFFTYDGFWNRKSLIRAKVFEEGAMPLSQRGHRNFWLSSPWQPRILADWLELDKVPTPGKPVARPVLLTQGQLRPGMLVTLDGSTSAFADGFLWSQLSGTTVPLQKIGSQASFVAPGAATLHFQLVATLGNEQSPPMTLDVSIIDAPTAPTLVTALAGVGQATVHWQPPAGDGNAAIVGYRVTASPGGAFAVTDGSGRQVVIPGLTSGLTYTFTVVATNALGMSGPPSAPTSPVMIPKLPGAPSGVAGLRGNGSVAVSWTAPDDGGATITLYTVTATPGGHIGLSSGATNATVSGLTNGVAYTFTVVATNVVGAGPASAASAPVTPATVPLAPTGISAVAGDSKATVSWTAPPAAGSPAITSYLITASTGPTQTVNCTATCPTSAAFTGLTNGVAVSFTVAGTNVVGLGSQSLSSNTVTPAALPGAPGTVTGVRGNGLVLVSFTAPASNGGVQITQYTATSSPGGFMGSVSCVPPAACATTVSVSGLTNGTAYTFTVVATNAAGNGPASAASAPVTPATIPGKPGITSATRGDKLVTVQWTAPASNGGDPITSYVVTASPGGATATLTCPPCSTLTAAVTGLTNGTAYTFTVAAVNTVGTGTASDPSSSVTPSTTPDAPAAPTASAGDSKANVSWSPPASNGGAVITSYVLNAYLNPAGTGTAAATANIDCTSGTICSASAVPPYVATVNGLTNGSQYWVTVTAVNVAGSSPASSPSVTAVVPSSNPAAPSAPTSVSAAAGTNQNATVFWGAPLANGTGGAITGYSITASPSIPLTTAGAGATQLTISSLTGGVNYTFTVSAANASGTGPGASAAAVAIVGPPQPPTSVTASLPGDQSATVSWIVPGNQGGSGHPITSYTLTPSTGGAGVLDCAGPCGSTNSAVVTGLTNGTSTTFTVVATNDLGSSTPSAASNAVTPAGSPFAPTLTAAVSGNSSAALAWTAAGNNGSAITSYQFFNGGTLLGSCNVPAQCTTSFTLGSLTNGTSYSISLKAVTTAGSSTASNALAVTPAGTPGTPTGVHATSGDTNAVVGWTTPSSNGSAIVSYQFFNGLTQIGSCIVGGTCTSSTSFTVAGLTNGTTYQINVKATNGATSNNQSAASGPDVAVVPAGTPGAPAITSATSGDSTAAIVWTAPASNNGSAIVSYQFFNGVTSLGSCNTPATCTTSFTLSGLTNGTAYSVTMKATNGATSANQSAASIAVGVTPAGVPDAPVINSVVAGAATLQVNWSAPVSTHGSAITGYFVSWSTSPGGLGVGSTSPGNATFAQTASVKACNYGSGSALCSSSVGQAYKFLVYAHNGSNVDVGNGAGWSLSSNGTGTPFVSYSNDNVNNIFTTAVLNVGGTCNGCHGGAPWTQSTATTEGTKIYLCPSANAGNNTCPPIHNMCSGVPCINVSGAEYNTLALWLANGARN